MTTYTNVINYTEQAANRTYKTFSEPLNNTRIMLFLTSLNLRANIQAKNTPLKKPFYPIHINMFKEVISTS